MTNKKKARTYKPVPGPWEAGYSDPWTVYRCHAEEVARVYPNARYKGEELNATAALIAAAPELLAALEIVLEAFIHKPGDTKGNKARTAPLKYCNAEFSAALTAARAAIAKAKGEA